MKASVVKPIESAGSPRQPAPEKATVLVSSHNEVNLKIAKVTACCAEAGHDPIYTISNKRAMFWHAAEEGHGNNHSITLVLQMKSTITRIGVLGGRDDSRLWPLNNRVKTMTAHFDDGEKRMLSFADNRHIQYITIHPIVSRTIKLEITGLYPGSRWHHTIISQARVLGMPIE